MLEYLYSFILMHLDTCHVCSLYMLKYNHTDLPLLRQTCLCVCINFSVCVHASNDFSHLFVYLFIAEMHCHVHGPVYGCLEHSISCLQLETSEGKSAYVMHEFQLVLPNCDSAPWIKRLWPENTIS